MAATATTNAASQTFTGHFATAPDSLARVRAEFLSVCNDSDQYKASDVTSLSKLDYLRKYVTLENSQDMTYLG